MSLIIVVVILISADVSVPRPPTIRIREFSTTRMVLAYSFGIMKAGVP